MNLAYSPAWSMQNRVQELSPEEKPGPGSYENTFPSGRKFSIGKAPRFPSIQPTNDPGSYEPRIQETNRSIVMCKSNSPGNTTSSPGPGRYDAPKDISGPLYSISGRNTIKTKPKEGPGPADYHLEHYEHTIPHKFKREKLKPVFNNTIGPGPGLYSVNSSSNKPSVKFTTSRRSKSVNSDGPGPGQYEIPSSISKMAYSIGNYEKKVKKNRVPGPGSYDFYLKDGKLPFKIKVTPRFPIIDKDCSPGPGHYFETDDNFRQKERFKSYSPEVRVRKNTVGPGSYHFKEDEGKPFTFKGRHPDTKINNLPGPGQYESHPYKMKYTRFSKGGRTEKTDESAKQEFPGPGTYTMTSPSNRTCTFGKSKKHPAAKRAGPGPSSYFIKPTFGTYSTYGAIPR